jgi:hypothetical protein
MELIWSQWHSDIIAGISAVISLIVLFTYILSNNIQNRISKLTEFSHKKTNSIVRFIMSEQFDDCFSVKLCFFNPDNCPVFIAAISINKYEQSKNLFKKLLSIPDYIKVEKYKWWPNYEQDISKEKFLADEYANLIVEKSQDIQIIIPGYRTRNYYTFTIYTNRGWTSQTTVIDAITTCFCNNYRMIK